MSAALLVALAVSAAAGLMRGFAGVGSGMLMAPFFVHLFGPVETVASIVLMELAVTAQLLPGVRRHIDWGVIAPMGLAAAAFMPLGSWLLHNLDAELIGDAIALLVTIFALVLLTGWRYTGPRPLPATLGVGAVSGVLIAMTSLGNPPVILYLLAGSDRAAVNRANFTGYFAVTLVAVILMMAVQGLIGESVLTRVVVLLPVFMLAAWVGSRLFRRSSEQLYRRVALVILLLAGLYALVR